MRYSKVLFTMERKSCKTFSLTFIVRSRAVARGSVLLGAVRHGFVRSGGSFDPPLFYYIFYFNFTFIISVRYCISQNMIREPFTIDSYVHVVKRGSRGLPIHQDEMDRWRTMLMLHHFNDKFHSENWFRDLMNEKIANSFKRASIWPPQKKIVHILAFTLMPNHIHLLLKEIVKGGIALFMGKLGKGMTLHHNVKYNEHGSLFQGPYRSRTISNDTYLRYVAVYIMVKNVFELFPGGLQRAAKDFEKAYKWGCNFQYSSLGTYADVHDYPFIDKDILGEIFRTQRDFKIFAKECIIGMAEKIADATFE